MSEYDDALVPQILGQGWYPCRQAEGVDFEGSVFELCSQAFSALVEGVSAKKARDLVEWMPPIRQVLQNLDSVYICREISAFEALHLRFDSLALLTEIMTSKMGKRGELVTYDILREERILKAGGKSGSVIEFIADFISEPQEASLFTASLET